MVRPIDISLNIQHAADMARAGSTQNQGRPEVTMQEFANRLEKQAREQQEQVQKSEHTEKNDVNPERQGYGGGYTAKRNAAKKKPEAKKKSPQAVVGESLFDIRV
ncbi:MAG: hypothetical protein FWB88_04720 [Defluviitaleaceae bacterium]|nr:hypothetical protein [Defluviitaleaceae bacterium]MCL2238668.1 hypothetical protein [Defluviitaleaceae bacterium]